RRVVTASGDKTARLWDAESGRARGESLRHEDIVWHAAFSPDGQRAVTASRDGTARLWDTGSGHALGVVMLQDPVSVAAFHPSADRLLVAGGGPALFGENRSILNQQSKPSTAGAAGEAHIFQLPSYSVSGWSEALAYFSLGLGASLWLWSATLGLLGLAGSAWGTRLLRARLRRLSALEGYET
ncbi:WD40 repeat domain-containing protein, partial [Azotobacter beijerinckii]|uniref:WD40 repeat domain-containing protein n=1 Tax=Azotobacter beijerinckii TaxID=170623 RepID=UPI00349E6586